MKRTVNTSTAASHFFRLNLFFLFFSIAWLAQAQPKSQINTSQTPTGRYSSHNISGAVQWADSIISQLTLEEKIGQLCIYTLALDESRSNLNLLETVIQKYKVGGLLFSGGNVQTQARLTNRAQAMSRVPLLITFDGEWGLAMRLKDTPDFPRNGTLGCITDDRLLYDYGQEVARQCRELGIQVNFAPVADVNINPKNPVIGNRSFGELPENVAHKTVAYAQGLESGGIISVAKHFPGHGDTQSDSHHTLPVLKIPRERLNQVELLPFRRYIESGLSGIMVGHLSVPALDSLANRPASLSPSIVTELLKNEMKFQGLVFTDALAMKGVAGSSSVCLDALKAGNDLLLVPRSLRHEIPAVLKAVQKGELSEAEIDRRCHKVLVYKYLSGLSNLSRIQTEGLTKRINDPMSEQLIRRLYQAAVTVIENPNQNLPWYDTADSRIALVEIGHSESLTSLAQSLTEQKALVRRFIVKPHDDRSRSRALCDSLATYDKVVVAINTSKLAPYQTYLYAMTSDSRLTQAVFVFFTSHKTLAACPGMPRQQGAVVLAHTSNHGIPERIGQILTGQQTANGRLAFRIGNYYPAGSGVRVAPPQKPKSTYRFTPQFNYSDYLRLTERIDSIASLGIQQGAYPGCQIAVWYQGQPLYEQCYGTLDGNSSHPVRPNTLYDLASLTKTSATLLAVMKLYDMGAIRLSDRLSQHLKWLEKTDKRHITIRDVLFHQSGLSPGLSIYPVIIDPESYKGKLFSNQITSQHKVRLGNRLWGNSQFRFLPSVSPVPNDSCLFPVCGNLWVSPSLRTDIQQQIIEQPIRPRSYRYSDTGFILLQFLVEELTGQPLNQFVDSCFYHPMHLSHTGYQPLNWIPADSIAPSAFDHFLRKSELRGFVHDETAAFMGGVAGHAGLFSNATEQAMLYQMLLNGGVWQGKRYLSEQTCRKFTTTVSGQSRRGLGFDRPAPDPEKSPCAPSAPLSVYGHTGFTGTCSWTDPDKKLILVFLSNRTYPDALNRTLLKLNIRSNLQQILYESGL